MIVEAESPREGGASWTMVRRGTISWMLAAFALVLALVLCARHLHSFHVREAKKRIEHVTGLTFTPGSRLTNYHYEEGLDAALRLRAIVPVAELSDFLHNTAFRLEALKPGKDYLTYGGPSWWQPYSHGDYRSGEDTRDPAQCYRILIALEDPESAVVYVEWFEVY